MKPKERFSFNINITNVRETISNTVESNIGVALKLFFILLSILSLVYGINGTNA